MATLRVFDQINIAIAVIVNAHDFAPYFYCEVFNDASKIKIYRVYVFLI